MDYGALWKILKTGKQVEISIAKEHHSRIIRRFRHESHKDRGFRLMCAEDGKSYRFVIFSFRNALTLKLNFSGTKPMPKNFL